MVYEQCTVTLIIKVSDCNAGNIGNVGIFESISQKPYSKFLWSIIEMKAAWFLNFGQSSKYGLLLNLNFVFWLS